MAFANPTDAPSSLPSVNGVVFRHLPDAPGYAVGDDGSVWSAFRNGPTLSWGEWRRLRHAISNGYPAVNVRRNGSRRLVEVHSLVLDVFVGPRPQGMQARHFPDPTKTNVALSNLSWATPVDNNADKVFHGTHQIGVRNPRAKLTERQVLQIREQASRGVHHQAMADDLCVSRTLVRLIVQRKCWTHI